MAMMSKDGLSKLELGSEKRRKGEGSGGEGLIKLSRSSLKNLDGGGDNKIRGDRAEPLMLKLRKSERKRGTAVLLGEFVKI